MSRFGKIFNSKAFKYTMAAIWLAVIIACLLTMRDVTIDEIVSFTPKNKAAAIVVMMLLFALKSLSVVMYSGVLFAALGVMFKLPYALALAILGSVVMASVPYGIGRLIGAGQIEKIEAKYPKLYILKELRASNDFLFVLLARLIGVLPFDVVSLYMGSAEMKYRPYLLASVLGMLQLAVPMTVMGYSVDDPTSPAFIISAAVQIVMTVGSTLAFFIYINKVKKKGKETTEKPDKQ